MNARFGRRHAEHTQERLKVELVAALVSTAPVSERPFEEHTWSLRKPEPIVQRRRPVAGATPPPAPDRDAVDRHLERAARSGSSHLHGPDERVPGVAVLVPRLERR